MDLRKQVLKNAVMFNGKPNPNAVLGKILSSDPDMRSQIPKLREEIQQMCTHVSKMSKEEQIDELGEIPKDEKRKKEGLKDLPDSDKPIVLRFEPSPSGALHIGHSYGIMINAIYAEKYNAKLILRISDTNPDNIYEPAYKLIQEDFEWLTGKKIQPRIQSDNLGSYYDLAEDLVKRGNAYMCECTPDSFRELLSKSKACPCRDISASEQLKRYAKMFSGYKPGEAVLRIKTNLNDPNPAMRDWPAMRINDHVHPRKKDVKVWPLMNFAVAIDDHMMGITHVLNGKDHMDNAKRQEWIYKYMNWKCPHQIKWGIINFTGLRLSTTETKKQIEYGEFTGWDDIRLPFIPSFRRKGYQPGAFRKMAEEMGITQNDKKMDIKELYKQLNSFNKGFIECSADRYFFVADPVELNISGTSQREVKLRKHPEFDRGYREFDTKGEFFITSNDMQRLEEGRIHRLMGCINFRINKGNAEFVSDSYEDYKNADRKGMIMHWVPKDSYVQTKIRMDDNSLLEGYAETGIQELKEGQVIQFERTGFVCRRGDEFWYTHK